MIIETINVRFLYHHIIDFGIYGIQLWTNCIRFNAKWSCMRNDPFNNLLEPI